MNEWYFNNEKLKLIREVMNLTQQAVADRVAVSRQTYNGWETGVKFPTLQSLIKLCNSLSVRPEIFFSQKE